MISRSRLLSFLLLVMVAVSANGFMTSKPSSLSTTKSSTLTAPISSTSLSERKWNFNEGRSPFGLKKNAEIWNGRVAQMAFVWVVLQELITGKGIFKGIEEGDPFFIANAAGFAVCAVGLTAFLAFKGAEDYTE